MKEEIKLEDFLKEVVEFYGFPITKEELLNVVYECKTIDTSNFAYEYVTEQSEKGDGEGYEDEIILKRKSDGKFFSLWSYYGKIQRNCLYEVKLVSKKIKKYIYER